MWRVDQLEVAHVMWLITQALRASPAAVELRLTSRNVLARRDIRGAGAVLAILPTTMCLEVEELVHLYVQFRLEVVRH
jgi:hypothetical protein